MPRIVSIFWIDFDRLTIGLLATNNVAGEYTFAECYQTFAEPPDTREAFFARLRKAAEVVIERGEVTYAAG